MKSCKTCEHFKLYKSNGRHGECRANPPRVMRPAFPEVDGKTDWCGKHSGKYFSDFPDHESAMREAHRLQKTSDRVSVNAMAGFYRVVHS